MHRYYPDNTQILKRCIYEIAGGVSMGSLTYIIPDSEKIMIVDNGNTVFEGRVKNIPDGFGERVINFIHAWNHNKVVVFLQKGDLNDVE